MRKPAHVVKSYKECSGAECLQEASSEVITLNYDQTSWTQIKNELVNATVKSGFPKELGELMAKQLGSPKAISRMIGYLENVKPKSEELVVD